jgi:hypothetical protein
VAAFLLAYLGFALPDRRIFQTAAFLPAGACVGALPPSSPLV